MMNLMMMDLYIIYLYIIQDDDFGSTKGTTANAEVENEEKEEEENDDNNNEEENEDEEFDDDYNDYNSPSKGRTNIPDYLLGNTEEPSDCIYIIVYIFIAVEDLNGDEDWLKQILFFKFDSF